MLVEVRIDRLIPHINNLVEVGFCSCHALRSLFSLLVSAVLTTGFRIPALALNFKF